MTDITSDFVNVYSDDGWGFISLILLWLGVFFFVIYVLSNTVSMKKLSFVFGLVLLFASFFCFGFAKKQYNLINNKQEAIVFSASEIVKSSPGDNGNDLFVLHEGTKVQLLDEVGAWGKIRLSDGSVGWIQVAAIKNI